MCAKSKINVSGVYITFSQKLANFIKGKSVSPL
uniref:Uncharacterized protein n=1 Tax=Anguilla anguilla TaxID=7936 RepID=A0A0E9RM53_ANGAN